MTTYWKLHKVALVLGLFSLILYYYFAYSLERSAFLQLIGLYGTLFLLCFKIIQFEKWNTRLLLLLGILFRLVFWAAMPNLSQDFYRFIWDGQMIINGFNPYLLRPDQAGPEILQRIPHAQELVQGMGELSARNFSNYPPLNQLPFAMAAWIGGNSLLSQVIVLRVFYVAADLGAFYFGRKVLQQLNVSPHMIFWYFLNPLVIIELSGNLHSEGFMISLFIMALYYIFAKKSAVGAIFYALSIAVKLIPLMFLPLFLSHFKIKRAIGFYTVIGVVLLLCMIPFYTPEMVQNFGTTMGLWFSNFEFNAGMYNGLKYIGLQLEEKPWEMIKTYGKLVPVIMLVIVFFTTILRKNSQTPVLMTSMLLILTSYFLLSATVHPWYIIFLVFLTLGTPYRYPIFWSAVIMLSYSAYVQEETEEQLGLIFLEYLIVFGMLIYEFFRFNREKLFFSKN